MRYDTETGELCEKCGRRQVENGFCRRCGHRENVEIVEVCGECGHQRMVNGFCEHCGFTDASKTKVAPLAWVVNKQSPSKSSVYVAGIKKAELDRIVGYKTISAQNCYSWIFLIKRADLPKLNL